MKKIGGDKAKLTAWIVAIVGTFLIMFILVKLMISYTAPPPVIDQARSQERAQALAELRAKYTVQLSSYAKLDAAKGVYQIPIDQAMKLVIQEWKHPAAARSNFLARVEKATAPLPPPPNPYE